jgi:topoisomerase-4 subunit B
MTESDNILQPTTENYKEEHIITLEWREHIRRRPGMYIGKLGDGSSPDDGIYVLLKEVLDNSIDEYMMGFGKTIEVKVEGTNVSVRDYSLIVTIYGWEIGIRFLLNWNKSHRIECRR